MRVLLFFILFTVISPLYSQSITEIELELSSFVRGETYEDKLSTARTLLKLDTFNLIGIRSILSYYEEKKIDSVSLFFDKLISTHPTRVEPFILRSELCYYEHGDQEESQELTWKLKYLQEALKVDPLNSEVLYKVSSIYYEDFIEPLKRNYSVISEFDGTQTIDSTFVSRRIKQRVSILENSADSSLYYFYKLWRVDKEARDLIYFPIKQLESFLEKASNSVIGSIDDIDRNCYFPSWYFANLPNNWSTDYNYDYLFLLELAKNNRDGLESMLVSLQEPCLYQTQVSTEKEIYRFDWTRSFHNPVIIRVEKSGNQIILFWKIGKYSKPNYNIKLKRKGKKKLTVDQWNKFVKLLNHSAFIKSPNKTYIPSTDGSSWTLEYKSAGTFKAHQSNEPKGSFRASCLFLLELSGIKIKKENIY